MYGRTIPILVHVVAHLFHQTRNIFWQWWDVLAADYLNRMGSIDSRILVYTVKSDPVEFQGNRGSEFEQPVRLQCVIYNLIDSVELAKTVSRLSSCDFIGISRNL